MRGRWWDQPNFAKDVDTAAAVERSSERIDALESSFRGELGDLRGEVREGLAENRRHTQVLFESLRDDIRILADGFARISAKIDSMSFVRPGFDEPSA